MRRHRHHLSSGPGLLALWLVFAILSFDRRPDHQRLDHLISAIVSLNTADGE
jgi:hypothetical protein